jgi:hypothetical protein
MSANDKSESVRGRALMRMLPVAGAILLSAAIGCSTTPPRQAVAVAPPAEALNAESGKVLVAAHTFQDVYYGAPFAAPPKLEVPDHWGNCQVVMQTPGRFRVLNTSGSAMEVTWKAVGPKAPPAPVLGMPQPQPIVRTTPAPAVQPVAASVPQPAPAPAARPASSPGDGLPAEPVPVGTAQ